MKQKDEEAQQFYDDLNRLIFRWTQESDQLTVGGMIAALEVIKFKLLMINYQISDSQPKKGKHNA